MNLSRLITRISPLAVKGDVDLEVKEIISDSRKAQPGVLFVAVRGTSVDGHAYIEQVLAAGASVIVCQTLPERLQAAATYIQVSDSAVALGQLASAWYGAPSEKLQLVGVTGTNGKTTVATLLYEMAQFMGYKAGLLSTVCNYIDGKAVEATHTTPDPLSLQRLLAEMVAAGCSYAFMEVSSHAADQKRIAGLHFSGGVFTNLTRDHLDYHKTVDAYLKAKKSFFDALPAEAFALTNGDDKNGSVMLQNTRAQKHSYALRTAADYKARILESHFEGTLLDLDSRELFVQFVGKFNAYNLLAVYGASRLLGFPQEEVLVAMSRLVPVAGRFQTIRSKEGVTAIVDYAHTPDALTNVLSTINEVLNGKGTVISVVGAGGNRDKGKRPLMAAEARRQSGKLILTSDNPRFEEPEVILSDMEAGLTPEELRDTLIISDRAQAIKTALQLAHPGDVVLVAGKGHENYQDIAGVKHPFSDKEVIEKQFGLIP